MGKVNSSEYCRRYRICYRALKLLETFHSSYRAMTWNREHLHGENPTKKKTVKSQVPNSKYDQDMTVGWTLALSLSETYRKQHSQHVPSMVESVWPCHGRSPSLFPHLFQVDCTAGSGISWPWQEQPNQERDTHTRHSVETSHRHCHSVQSCCLLVPNRVSGVAYSRESFSWSYTQIPIQYHSGQSCRPIGSLQTESSCQEKLPVQCVFWVGCMCVNKHF